MPDRASLTPYLVLTVMPLFFVSNLVIGRAAAMTVNPFTLAFLRWAIAFALIAPFALALWRSHAATLKSEAGTLLLLGFLGMWICGAGVYYALRYTTATNATLIYTASPVLVVLAEALIGRTRLSAAKVIGILLAIVGVMVIVLRGEPLRLLSLTFNRGDLIIATCAIAWAIYSLILKRPAFATLPTAASFSAIAGAGALTLLPFTVGEVVVTGEVPVTGAQWASILGVALICSLLAFSAYQYGIKRVGASTTSVFMYLMPAYGVLLAVGLLGERFEPFHAVGLAGVMAGIVLATNPALLLGFLRRQVASRG